jgi:hypothetical protein
VTIPLPPSAVCRECDTGFDPELVYRTFLVEFEARTGFVYNGRRPPWVRNFCSEACRYVDNRKRIDGHNEKTAARRAAEK